MHSQIIPAYWWQMARRCAKLLEDNKVSPHFVSDADATTDAVERRARGFIGEFAFLHAHPRAEWESLAGSDVKLAGKSIEVKTKFWRKPVDPEDLVQVANAQRFQQPDYYVFARIVDVNTVVLLGSMERFAFWRDAISIVKGGEDPYRSGWKAPCDCHALQVKQLIPLKVGGLK